MRKNSLKVLMLGWEFPPILSGGLGQACYGLANALSSRVALTVILPKRDPKSKLSSGHIIGLNQLDYADEFERKIEKTYEEFSVIKYVDASFDLYPIADRKKKIVSTHKKELHIEKQIKKISPLKQLFNEEHIYGANIIEKVNAYAKVVTELACKLDFDIIHAHDWVTFPAAMMLKEKYQKPFVVHCHSLETDRSGIGATNKVFEIEKKGMEAASFVFTVSNYTRSCIQQHYKIPIQKMIVVHNGIDHIGTLSIKKKSENADNQVKKILFLGRITRQKGPGFLVETALHLLKKQQNITFIVAGIGDRLRETMFYAKQRDILHKFEFLGFLDKKKVAELLTESDVYFMPSISEPFGLAALEAAQAGLPVVASKQSGINEVLPEILKANFWDTATFANYLYALLNYDGLGKEISKLTKKAIPSITWTKAAEDICFYYEKLNTIDIKET
ncbi:MAG: glycosyltransferase family 4 protein [Bacteroidota bacterium]